MLSHTHTLSDVAYTIMYRVKSTFTQHVCMLVCVLVCECVHMHACGCCCHGIVVCFHGVDSSVESKIATERVEVYVWAGLARDGVLLKLFWV